MEVRLSRSAAGNRTSIKLNQVQPIHLGLSLTKSVGGQGESIRHFHEVLGGTIVSFSSQLQIEREASYIPGTIHVPVAPDPVSKLIMRPSAGELSRIQARLSDHNLIIVNLLYRYHVHWAFTMARRLRVPIWMVTHGALDPYVFRYRRMQKSLWLAIWGKKYLASADRVIFSTEAEREKADAVYSGPNTRVIAWPVEIRKHAARHGARLRVQNKFEIPATSRSLLFLGRYEKVKRPLETIELFAKAKPERTVLIMAGITEQYSCRDLHEHAVLYGIRDKVRIIGSVYGQQKEDLLLGSDGFISLSWKENFGYATAEALASGTPVILSPGNDLRSLIQDADCGWMLADFEDETAIAALTSFDLAPDCQLQGKGATAYEWAKAHLKFSAFRDALLAEIE